MKDGTQPQIERISDMETPTPADPATRQKALDAIHRTQDRMNRDKVFSALDAIERAQNVIEQAARELSSVEGYAEPWGKLCRFHAQVKKQWHALNNFRIARQNRSSP